VSFVTITFVLLLNECLSLEAYISLSTQSGNFWHTHVDCVVGDWIQLAQGTSQKRTSMNAVETHRIPNKVECATDWLTD